MSCVCRQLLAAVPSFVKGMMVPFRGHDAVSARVVLMGLF